MPVGRDGGGGHIGREKVEDCENFTLSRVQGKSRN